MYLPSGQRKTCYINSNYSSRCLTSRTQVEFIDLQDAMFECKLFTHKNESNPVETSNSRVTLIATCGPEDFRSTGTRLQVKGSESRSFSYTCPVPKGTSRDFIYLWYKSRINSLTRVSNNKVLVYDTKTLPVTYWCVVRNKNTNKQIQHSLLVYMDPNEEQERSILWVIMPALLIVITVPLLYIAYLKLIGDFDLGNFWREKIFKDEVDYMVTQVAGVSSEEFQYNNLTNRAKMGRFLRRTVGRMSMALNKIHSSASVTPSVVASLPITDSFTKIKKSKSYRVKRAQLLKEIGVSPFFQRPTRNIRKLKVKKYSDGDESNWVTDSMRKVERWQKKNRNQSISSDSIGTLEDLGVKEKAFEGKFSTNTSKLVQPQVPCNKDEWIELHRLAAFKPDDAPTKFGFEADIIELSDRLLEMYLTAKPHKTYFPTVRKIGDPFQPILMDKSHPSHVITKAMWKDYMDKMFAVSTDVGNFNKLSRKVLERTLNNYGNPDKIPRATATVIKPEATPSKQSAPGPILQDPIPQGPTPQGQTIPD